MRKLAIFSAAFAAATAVYVYALQDVRALWLAGACLALSVLGRWLQLRRVSVALLGAAVAVLWCFVYEFHHLEPQRAMVGEERTVTVIAAELPRETRYGYAVEGTVDGVGVMLYGEENLSVVKPGDRITITGEVAMSGLEIWNDESLYLRSKGVELVVYGSSEPEVVLGTPTGPQRIRIWLQNRIDQLYETEAAALVKALLTGDRSGLSFATENELSVAGLRHAVAVSGMHVSMLLMLISMACGGSPRLRAWIGVPVVVLFAVMTGASPSVCRAAVMQVLMLCAPLARREVDSATTLAAPALLLLIENPWSIASVSFQLSFAAVAGLFLLSGSIRRKLLSLQKQPGLLLRFVASTVSATFGASALTLPLCVYYFRLISVAAPLTNLLTLWAVTGIFTLGLLSCCLGPVGPMLAWVVTKLCAYVLTVCRWIASFPYAAAYPDNLPLFLWAIAAFCLMLLLLVWRKKLPTLWLLSGLLAAFLACILTARVQFFPEVWRFTALDVGQGQCLLLQIGEYTAVVDCGGTYPEEAGELLARKLHSAGVTKIDTLILTHYDSDHAGGAPQLAQRVRVQSILLPNLEDDTGIKAALEALDTQVYVVETLTEITVPNGKITLYPMDSRENDNNGGVCVLATAAEYDILVTGDLDQYAEMRMISRWSPPEADLLVAGHHGSKNASSRVLLELVRPKIVVISVGEDNDYGHPAPETLQRLEAVGAQVLRTDQLGTIAIEP